MKETELNEVLNYMKQYVENKYEHASEPMLTYKDLQLVLEEIEDLKEQVEYQDLWREEYLRRIDKAIEYIDTDYINGKVDGLSWLEVRKLLDILQGSDKE